MGSQWRKGKDNGSGLAGRNNWLEELMGIRGRQRRGEAMDIIDDKGLKGLLLAGDIFMLAAFSQTGRKYR